MSSNLSSISYKKEEIDSIAINIGSKLSSYESVKQHADSLESSKYKSLIWNDLAISEGFSSLLLLFGELSEKFPEDDWDIIAHNHLINIQQLMKTSSVKSFSSFVGLAGIGFSIDSISKNGTRYTMLTKQILSTFKKNFEVFIDLYDKSFESSNLKSYHYDTFYGLSGITRYLLLYKDDPEILEIIKKILKFLVKITRDIKIKNFTLPGWSILSNTSADNAKTELSGKLSNGMAHGIAGPLSILALSVLQNIYVDGIEASISKIADWLISFSYTKNDSIIINTHIDFDTTSGITNSNNDLKCGWCNGSPGIARAIFLAGKAIKNDVYTNFSISVFDSICTLPIDSLNLYSPTFCHGFSGLLHLYQLMYADTQKSTYRDFSISLTDKILLEYDFNSIFGFKNTVKDVLGDFCRINTAGLLEGSVGVALTLLALNNPIKTNWNKLFLVQ